MGGKSVQKKPFPYNPAAIRCHRMGLIGAGEWGEVWAKSLSGDRIKEL